MTAFLHPEHPHEDVCPSFPHCSACAEYVGWYSEHDSATCDRLVAIESALDNLIDALLHSEDWEVDAAFWLQRLHELEASEP